jgi:hypothetical protein
MDWSQQKSPEATRIAVDAPILNSLSKLDLPTGLILIALIRFERTHNLCGPPDNQYAC